MDIYPFDNPADADRFYALTQSLRCTVCQNQTLSESYMPLAVALRQDIYQRMQAKQKEADIVAWVVQEHGHFVSYMPPVIPLTWGLWFGPFLMLVCGLWVAFRQSKKQETKNYR